MEHFDNKNQTISLRKNPFEDFDDDEFKTQFRLAKTRPTVKKLREDIGELATYQTAQKY